MTVAWSGLDIASWFVEEHARKFTHAQGTEGFDVVQDGKDYCYVWVTAYVDLDMDQYFLLDVRTNVSDGETPDETRDFLFVRWCNQIECEWQNEPIPFGWPAAHHLRRLGDGLIWFANRIEAIREQESGP